MSKDAAGAQEPLTESMTLPEWCSFSKKDELDFNSTKVKCLLPSEDQERTQNIIPGDMLSGKVLALDRYAPPVNKATR
jgi:hypothetical protein